MKKKWDALLVFFWGLGAFTLGFVIGKFAFG